MLRLRFERLEQRRSLDNVARAAGMRIPLLQMLECERVNPTEKELVCLASALGVWPPSVLLEVVESKRRPAGADATTEATAR